MKKFRKFIHEKWLVCAVMAALTMIFTVGCGADSKSVTPSEPDASGRYHVGDTVVSENGEAAATYEECETECEFDWGPEGLFAPEDDQMIIRVYFTIKNTGKDKFDAGCAGFECTADGTSYDHDFYTVQQDDADPMPISEEIRAGKSVKGNIYFRVPKDAQNIEVSLGSKVFVVE